MLAAREEPGEANSESRVELVEHRGGVGRYRLLPATGRTHQLAGPYERAGAADRPRSAVSGGGGEAAGDDFSRPLQLLARVLEFTDPVGGEPRRFVSGLRLSACPEG